MTISTITCRSLLCLGLLVGLCAASELRASPAQDDQVDVFEPPQRTVPAPEAPQATPEIDQHFQKWVFGKSGPTVFADARQHLEQILVRKIARLDRICVLQAPQQNKLKIAGGRDIDRLFRDITQLHERFRAHWQKHDRNQAEAHVREEVSAKRSQLRTGPFGTDSLFDRLENTILTTVQRESRELRFRQLVNSTKPISPANARELEQLRTIRHELLSFAWSPDGQYLGCQTAANQIEILSAANFEPVSVTRTVPRIHNFEFSPTANLLVLSNHPEQVVIRNWRLTEDTQIETGRLAPIVRFNAPGTQLATGGWGGLVQVWSAKTGQLVFSTPPRLPSGWLTPAFSPDGTLLAVGHSETTTQVFDTATGELQAELPGRKVRELKFAPDGQVLATVGSEGDLVLWDINTGKMVQSVASRTPELLSVDWSPDGRLLATSGNLGTVALWNATDLTLVAEIEAPESVPRVRFNATGTRLAFAGGSDSQPTDRRLEIWAIP
ncbi:MAG: hypothetical protein JSS02_05020 [Planctomycetes bacterium]|nr:hypothetical protein [Planctomycetota bacterium]